MTIRLNGETPAKKNNRVIDRKTGRSFPSMGYRQWHERAMCEVNLQSKVRNICEPCKIAVTFVHGDLRRRDSDNGLSSILDLLTDCRILQDDNWQIVREVTVTNEYEKGNPHCTIQIMQE